MIIIATAVALFTGKAPVQGGANSGQFSPVWLASAPAPAVVGSSDMTCTVAPGTPNTTLNVNITSAFPGGQCTIDAAVNLPMSNAQNGKITGMDLTLPTDWTVAVLDGDCGKALVRGTPEVVRFQITMGANATMGEATTFAATNGLAVAPSSQNAPLGPGCV